ICSLPRPFLRILNVILRFLTYFGFWAQFYVYHSVKDFQVETIQLVTEIVVGLALIGVGMALFARQAIKQSEQMRNLLDMHSEELELQAKMAFARRSHQTTTKPRDRQSSYSQVS
ncbi:MAG: hypothetical protein ABUL72_06310, partial [Armatimonadota bacterium]